MPVPARRHSSSKVRRRRSHDAMKAVHGSACVSCGAPVLSHRACKSCGSYKGKVVVSKVRAQARLAKKVGAQKPVPTKGHDHDHGHDHKHE